MKKVFTLKNSLVIFGGILLVLVVLNFGLAGWTNYEIREQRAVEQEKQRPPKLELIHITSSTCTECSSMNDFIMALGQAHVNLQDVKELTEQDIEAQSFINQYGVTKLPVLLISGELNKDETIKENLISLGSIKDDRVIIESIFPPYKDLETGEVRGLLQATILEDEFCESCYDHMLHQQILQSMGINVVPDVYDVASKEGRELIKKYDITMVPTVILSGDYQPYTDLLTMWDQVGTIEKDALVLRDGLKNLGTYKDLTTGDVVEVAINQSNDSSGVSTNSPGYQDVSSSAFSSLIQKNNTIVLDVRNSDEFASGHLQNAINIPVTELINRLGELDPSQEILVYCQSGNRSKTASQILVENGFTHVTNLQNGINEWQAEGFNIIK